MLSLILAAALAGPMTAGVGDAVFHADLTEKLSILGGPKRQMGTVDVRYMGLASAGHPRFRRTDVQVFDTSEALAPVRPTVLPPTTVDMVIDMAADPVLHVNGHTFRILAASTSSVTYEADK